MVAAAVETSWPVVVYTALSFAFAALFHLLFFWAIVKGIKRRRAERDARDP